jgi:CheY-like chemotaxis protein
MSFVAAITVHLLQGHPSLKPLIAGLGGDFVVVGSPAKGDDPHCGVGLVAAFGLAPEQALARVAAASQRHGLPTIGVIDLPLPAGVDPGTLLPFAQLTAGALARALRLARSRADARTVQEGEASVGAAVDAALRTIERRLNPITVDLAHLRRQVMGDPRAARHAEALAFGLRAIESTMAAALEDAAGGLPIPAHALPSLAEPLLRAVLGSGARLECDASDAPLGLVAADAIELLAHAVCEVRPLLPAGEAAKPAVRVVVGSCAGEGNRCRVTVACSPPPEDGVVIRPATAAAAIRCGGEASLDGTTLVICLPLVRQTAIPDPQVLVVDDQIEVAAVVADVLRDDGLTVATVGSAELALDHLARHPGIRVLVSDVALPGLDGVDLAGRLAAARCPVRILLITAYAEDRPEAAEREGLVAGVLPKPFDPAVLLASVRRLLG